MIQGIELKRLHGPLPASHGTVPASELRRTAAGWRISKLELELLWGESKLDEVGFFASIGGRGPIR